MLVYFICPITASATISAVVISIIFCKEIIKKETELLDFIIDKNLANCSLEKLKEDYTFYCKDLCDEMETGFIDYLFVFFQDKGMPAFATTIKEGIKFRIAYEVVRDLKIALVSSLYGELIEYSFKNIRMNRGWMQIYRTGNCYLIISRKNLEKN